jgi:hypothetical protein
MGSTSQCIKQDLPVTTYPPSDSPSNGQTLPRVDASAMNKREAAARLMGSPRNPGNPEFTLNPLRPVNRGD